MMGIRQRHVVQDNYFPKVYPELYIGRGLIILFLKIRFGLLQPCIFTGIILGSGGTTSLLLQS